MSKSLVVGSLVGALIAFVWSFVSWDVLPWHNNTLLAFEDEGSFGQMILAHTARSGVYLYPGIQGYDSMTAEQKKAAEAEQMKKMEGGPVMLAAVRREGYHGYANGLILQFLSQLLSAILFTWLLMKTRGLSYWGGVAFLTVAGLAAGIFLSMPNWIWWGFSASYTGVTIADSAATWLLAGLAISRLARPQQPAAV